MERVYFIIMNSFMFICLALCASKNGYASEFATLDQMPNPKRIQAIKPILTPAPPQLDLTAYMLIDADSGKIIAQKNADQRVPPASLTKLMSLYLISDALHQGRIKLEDEVRISQRAWKTGGSRMFVKAGQTVSVRDLIQGIIVASGNDACVAMAEFLAGNEQALADLMNQHAKALGMEGSHFTDSTGMPHPNHYTTAKDMAILARALISQFPEYYPWYKAKWFKFNGIKQPNRNRLLWRDPSVDGLKTGHTKEAGFCLVSSAKKNDMRLIAVLLGAPSEEARAADSERLLTYGFRFFETHQLYQAGQVLDHAKVWMGAQNSIPVGLAESFVVTIPHGSYQQLQANMVFPNTLHAPIRKGDKVGELTIELNGKVIAQRPLIALQHDLQAGLLKRTGDKARMTLQHWFSQHAA